MVFTNEYTILCNVQYFTPKKAKHKYKRYSTYQGLYFSNHELLNYMCKSDNWTMRHEHLISLGKICIFITESLY